jgi:hypothetical protein
VLANVSGSLIGGLMCLTPTITDEAAWIFTL